MKKSIVFSAIIIAGLIGSIFTSCKITPKDANKIIFDSIVVNEHVTLLEVNDTTLPYADLNINFLYPKQFKTSDDLTRLQQIFIGTFFRNVDIDNLTPQEAMDFYTDNYKKEYKSLSETYYEEIKQLPEGNTPMWYWYYMSLHNEILFQNDALLSYAVHYSDYTGGAHGSYNIVYSNIDLQNLTTIAEEDIFVPNYQKTLANIIINRLMIQNDVSTRDGLLEIGFFNVDEIFPNNNFFLDDEGVHYAFNQYEIAPYVMGMIEVNIPYEDLREILKPNSIIDKAFAEKE